MLGDISKAEKIYIATGYTDMRKSIDGLAALVQQNFHLDPFQNALFLFCGHKNTTLKDCIGNRMGLYYCINDLKTGSSNGPELNPKLKKSLPSSCAGYLKD